MFMFSLSFFKDVYIKVSPKHFYTFRKWIITYLVPVIKSKAVMTKSEKYNQPPRKQWEIRCKRKLEVHNVNAMESLGCGNNLHPRKFCYYSEMALRELSEKEIIYAVMLKKMLFGYSMDRDTIGRKKSADRSQVLEMRWIQPQMTFYTAAFFMKQNANQNAEAEAWLSYL